MRVQIGIERHADVAQEWASFFCNTNLPGAQLYQAVLFQWTQGLQLRSEFFSKTNAELIAALLCIQFKVRYEGHNDMPP